MSRRGWIGLLVCVGFGILGCDDEVRSRGDQDTGSPADSGGSDSGVADSGVADSGPGDAGAVDGGEDPGCAVTPTDVLRVHYQNASLASAYPGLYMWTWNAWSPEKDVPSCGVDEFGAIFDVPREHFTPGVTMGFKFKKGPGTAGPWYEMDRAWTEGTDPWEVWVVQGDVRVYASAADSLLPKITAVYWDTLTELAVEFDRPLPGIDDAAKYGLQPGALVEAATKVSDVAAVLTVSPLDLQAGYTLSFDSPDGLLSSGLLPRRVLDGFDSDAPLGAWLDEQGNSHFAVFAPRATEVVLHTAPSATAAAQTTHPLVRDAATGIWSVTVPGNLDGTYYWYTVAGPQAPGERFDPTRPLNDPYALVALSSFGGVAGRSLFVDLSRLSPATQLARPPLEGLVAYELHVRDLTGGPGSGLTAADPEFRRYLGFTRAGLTGPAHEGVPVKTGLDHLVELGVSAVQLLPVQEFPADEREFNWGYFTANFFSPEGMYSSAPEGDARLFELKQLIDALHERGIAVILDVVFNHSAEGSAGGPAYNFKGFDSKYYYRQDAGTFTYAAGSGVGNELASERPMMRRYILDCLRFWTARMGVDGFRFDLAGLMDLDTVRAIAAEFPDRYLYGEPWAASGALWGKGAVNAIDPWAVFDDTFRDVVKGSPEGTDGGFVQGQGEREKLKVAITGNSLRVGSTNGWASAPTDGVRYLDAHDNLTLADKLDVSIHGSSPEAKEARVKLAGTILLTSPGPVMLHAGVEFLRSKPYSPDGDGRPIRAAVGERVFDANSYRSSDRTNNLDWNDKANHFEVFQYYAGLIGLRRGELGQPLRVPGAVPASYFAWHEDAANPHALGYTLNADQSNGARRLRVFVNSSPTLAATFAVDFPAAAEWKLVANSQQVDLAGLEAASDLTETVVEPLGVRIYAAAR
ncbi:MAG: alpha-amylase family glycosyl hydrolase [Myxococcota bacterium]|nr:alpha-amylase family glycosyl hydrolase [Myxococcota bacterium]